MAEALNKDALEFGLKSNRVKKFRVEFYVPNTDERTAADVPEKSAGCVTLVLTEEHWKNVAGIAYKRANPRCLEAKSLRIFELSR